jgi:hypothetical protein
MPAETAGIPEAAARAAAPACPRCGYDLSAATFGWSESCPLDGRCSECGLEFGWREIFRPDTMPWWWIEGARGFRQVAAALVLLPFVSCAAGWIFARIRLGQHGRPRRLAACLLVPIVLIHAFGVAASIPSLFRVPWNGRLAPLSDIGAFPRMSRPTGIQTATNLVVALPQAMVPFHRFLWLPYCEARGTAFGGDDRTGQPLGNPPSPAWVGAAWVPWNGDAAYRDAVLKDFGPFVLVATILVPMCSVLTFAALPVTRRRAKVRAMHLLRCGAMAIAMSATTGAALMVSAVAIGSLASLPGAVVPVFPAIGLGFIVFWWTRAIRDYLRMPHAWAVAVSIVLVGVLGALVILLGVGQLLRTLGLR